MAHEMPPTVSVKTMREDVREYLEKVHTDTYKSGILAGLNLAIAVLNSIEGEKEYITWAKAVLDLKATTPTNEEGEPYLGPAAQSLVDALPKLQEKVATTKVNINFDALDTENAGKHLANNYDITKDRLQNPQLYSVKKPDLII